MISSRIIRIHLAIGETPPFHAPFWFQSNRSHAVIHREYYPFLKILNRFRPRHTRGGRQLVDGRITVFGSLSNREIYPSPLYARIISQQHGIIRESEQGNVCSSSRLLFALIIVIRAGLWIIKLALRFNPSSIPRRKLIFFIATRLFRRVY